MVRLLRLHVCRDGIVGAWLTIKLLNLNSLGGGKFFGVSFSTQLLFRLALHREIYLRHPIPCPDGCSASISFSPCVGFSVCVFRPTMPQYNRPEDHIFRSLPQEERKLTRHMCINCMRFKIQKLKICGKCLNRFARYCSKECQAADWIKHRPFCHSPQ